MKKVSKDVKTYWLWMYGMNKVFQDEMLEHFRNYYGFEGNFQELIEELVDEYYGKGEKNEKK